MFVEFLKHKKTQMTTPLQHGVGAVCTALLKYLHPSKLVAKTYVNFDKKLKLDKLLCIGKEVKVVNKKEQLCYVFRHEDFPNQLLWTVC